jgi:hypothetical protein
MPTCPASAGVIDFNAERPVLLLGVTEKQLAALRLPVRVDKRRFGVGG